MEHMLYSGKVFSLYAQIAIFDAEHGDSYPEWGTGAEGFVVGDRGIAVAVVPDEDIQVQVLVGDEGRKPDRLLTSATIQAGGQGLIVGNILSCSFAQLWWPSGQSRVSVYANGSSVDDVTDIVFVLEHLG